MEEDEGALHTGEELMIGSAPGGREMEMMRGKVGGGICAWFGMEWRDGDGGETEWKMTPGELYICVSR